MGDRSIGGAGEALVIVHTSDRSALGKRFPLGAAPFRIGASSDCDLVLRDEAVAPSHARLELRGTARWIVDLTSYGTYGTWLNEHVLERAPGDEAALSRGDRIQIAQTGLEYLSGADIEDEYHRVIYRMTILDGLTRAHNRRFLFEALDAEVARASKRDRALSLVVIDVDHLKAVNDELGRVAGDMILRQLVLTLQPSIRRGEVLARVGGEEFAVLLPGHTLDDALARAEHLRGLVERSAVLHRSVAIPLTISAGVASLSPTTRTVADLLRGAEDRLQEAKNAGRNRVRDPIRGERPW